MSLVDYADSDEDAAEQQDQQSRDATENAALAPPRKQVRVDLSGSLGGSAVASRPAAPPRRSFFYSEADEAEGAAADDGDSRARAKRKAAGPDAASGRSTLADILPAPKNKVAATAKAAHVPQRQPLPPPPQFDDVVEEEILAHKLQVEPDFGGDQRTGVGDGLAGDLGGAFGGAYGQEELPDDLQAHLRTGGTLKEVSLADLRRQDSRSAAVAPISIGPTIAAVNAPGKAAKVKHQLTYLAFRAREQESQLMEKRASGSKTKSQTMSKYGW